MPFNTGRKKTGGRKKGSLNRINADLKDRLSAAFPDYCPIEEMARIALNFDEDVTIRLTAHKEIAQYIYPKRKAVEVTGSLATTTLAQILQGRRKGRDSKGQ
jgi:hypothetical protein